MVKIRYLLILLLLVLSFQVAAENDCIYYFTSAECDECEEVDELFDYLTVKYPDLQIEEYDAYFNQEDGALLEDYFLMYDIPDDSQGIPAVFIGESYLIGNSSIQELLEGRIVDNENNNCPSLENTQVVGVVGEDKSPSDVMKTINFFKITGSALGNGFQPVMIAVFLILFALLSTIKKDEILVKKGFIFVGIVFLIHLISGFTSFMGFGGKAPYLFYKIIGFLVIVISIVRIKGFLGTWRAFLKTVPDNLKEFTKKILKGMTSTTGFVVIAVLVSLFILSSWLDMGILLQNLFHVSGLKPMVLPLLLYYSFITVLPMIALVAVLYFIHNELEDKAEEKVEENSEPKSKILKWKQHYHRILSFIASSIMLMIGLILLFV